MKLFYILCGIALTVSLFFWWNNDFAYPLFCTTRGCVTNIQWEREKNYQRSFADVAQTSTPNDTAVLTTLVRRHLISSTGNITSIAEDATRYRTDVLRFTEEEEVRQLGFSSFQEYDNAVTIPFLLQQAYIKEHGLASPQEAYAQLSQNFRVLSLNPTYTWDASKGEAMPRT